MIGRIDLVSVTMPFLDALLSVQCLHLASWLQYRFIIAQTHRSSFVRDGLLVFHDGYDRIRCLFVEFRGVRFDYSADIPRKRDDGDLQS